MIFSKENRDDIIKYYNKAIVKFAETGDRLWKIEEIDYDTVYCVDVDGFELHIDLSSEYEVDYPLPGRVCYQKGDSAACLVRKPAKQYIRGISAQNTMLLFLSSLGIWKQIDVNLKNLQQFVDKPAYQDVDKVDFKEMKSAALNRHFCITYNKIMAITKEIGNINHVDKTYKIHHLFEQEAKQLFPKWEKL